MIIFSILFVCFTLLALIGVYMINRVGNYENVWGMMFFYGAAAATISFLALVILLVTMVLA